MRSAGIVCPLDGGLLGFARMLAIFAQLDPADCGDQPSCHGCQGEGLEDGPILGFGKGFQALGHPGHLVDEVIARHAVLDGCGSVDLAQADLEHCQGVVGYHCHRQSEQGCRWIGQGVDLAAQLKCQMQKGFLQDPALAACSRISLTAPAAASPTKKPVTEVAVGNPQLPCLDPLKHQRQQHALLAIGIRARFQVDDHLQGRIEHYHCFTWQRRGRLAVRFGQAMRPRG